MSDSSVTLSELRLLADVSTDGNTVAFDEVELLLRRKKDARAKQANGPHERGNVWGTKYAKYAWLVLAATVLHRMKPEIRQVATYARRALQSTSNDTASGAAAAVSCTAPCILQSACPATNGSSIVNADAGAPIVATEEPMPEPPPDDPPSFTPVELPFDPVYLIVAICIVVPCVIGSCMAFWLLSGP